MRMIMEYPIKRTRLAPDIFLRKNLEDFVIENTHRFFDILGISSRFFWGYLGRRRRL